MPVTPSNRIARPLFQWGGIIALATLVDLAARFAVPFDLERVLRVEAMLFPTTGAALFWLMRQEPRLTGWHRILQWVLVASFLLAGLRSALWAGGVPVMAANFTLLAVAGGSGVGAWLWRRRR